MALGQTLLRTRTMKKRKMIIVLGLLFAATASALFCGSARASEKILLGPHIGDATIIGISGTNSDKAIVKFRRELDDEIEDCTREGDPSDSKTVAQCVKDGLAQEAGHIYTRRAFCSRLTLYTEFGNFSMVNHEKEAASVIDGKSYRPMRTDWKDHRTGEIVGNCSACNTPQMLSTLKVLCPVFYNQLFNGYDPY